MEHYTALPTSLVLIPLLISISAAGLLRLRLDTAEAGDIFRHAKRCLNTSFADSGNIHLCLLLLLTKDRSFSELLSVKSAIACCTCVHAGQCPRRAVSTPSLTITIQFRQTFLLGSAGIWGSSSFRKKTKQQYEKQTLSWMAEEEKREGSRA